MYQTLLLLIINLLIITPPNIQGSYKHSYKNGAFQMIDIHYCKSGKILFYLEANRGAADYNSGAIYGELNYNAKAGYYEYIPTDAEGCKLSMKKQGTSISIKTLKGDCDFGYGVQADGSYPLKSGANPQYIITRANKRVYFENTPLNKFSED